MPKFTNMLPGKYPEDVLSNWIKTTRKHILTSFENCHRSDNEGAKAFFNLMHEINKRIEELKKKRNEPVCNKEEEDVKKKDIEKLEKSLLEFIQGLLDDKCCKIFMNDFLGLFTEEVEEDKENKA